MNDPVDAPAASVILPVYNAARYVESAVISVLNQSFSNFEILLLDDGSTDTSLSILHTISAKDSRCRLVTRENRGLVRTLNEGVELARAGIIFRMDADDICQPRRFELQMSYLRDHPQCVAVGSDVMLIDPEGQKLRPWGVPCRHAEIDGRHMQGIGNMMVHPATAFRKAALLRCGGYREEFRHAEDFDLYLRLAEIGELANMPDVLLEYRQHLASIGYSHTSAQIAATDRAVAEARVRRGITVNAESRDAVVPAGPAQIDDVHRKWAWWALSAGNVSTARKHALQAVKRAPFAPENLRLLACVLRGH